MRYRLYILALALCASLLAMAQPYSFEATAVPSAFATVGGGKLSSSTEKSKLGTRSLRWDWVKGSYLRINTPDNLAAASRLSAGGITLFVYSPTPLDAQLSFRFYANTTLRCQNSFNLTFHGWRSFWNRFAEDMGHNRSELTQLRIYAPSKGEAGTLYFDLMEFSSSVPWSRMTDAQYTVAQAPTQEPFWQTFQHTITPSANPTTEELTAAERIAERTDEWFLGAERHSAAPEYKARLAKINSWINTANRNYPSLGLTRNDDGTVRGKGLFMMDYTSTIDNTQPLLFRTISAGYMIQLAYDYRRNASTAAAEYLLTLYDWFHDQGWAAGSALGTLYFEKLRSGGYFNSLFLMRHTLDEQRLSRELETLRWYTLFGTALRMDNVGETADNLRTLLTPKLYYALMLPSPAERVAALHAFRDYCTLAFTPNSSYYGTFKNDGLGGHHKSIYLGAYFPDALYTASQVAFLLHDTPFALPQEVLLSLKESLLAYTDVCAEYDVPVATNGRFPDNPQTLNSLLFAFPYVALALGGDTELVEAMQRLWRPTETPIKSVIESAGISITYTASLGEITTALDALALTSEKETKGVTSRLFPFGALGIYRTHGAHVSVKSASRYVWDFESGNSTENPFGRYLGNGIVETCTLASGAKNPCFPTTKDTDLNTLFRWSRLPGATTIDLPNSALAHAANNSLHRNFTDQPFVGGSCLNDSVALYALSFHDQTFAPSFYFQKSQLRLGNAFLCLGTGIRNTQASAPTITTLFQTELMSGQSILVNGSPYSFDGALLSNPTLIDNHGTAYVVLAGNVRIHRSTANNRSIVTAYIEHGTNPSNSSYRYLFIPAASAADLAQWDQRKSPPLSLLQTDNNAHIVHYPAEQITAYTLYNSGFADPNGVIRSVSSPSILLLQQLSSGHYHLSFSDPDLRRPYAKNMGALTQEDDHEPCRPHPYTLTLNGYFVALTLPEGFSLSYEEGRTLITGTVSEGRSYHLTLQSDSTLVDNITGAPHFFLRHQNPFLTIDYRNLRPYSVTVTNIAGATLTQTGTLTGKATIPLHLARGVYFAHLKDDTGTFTRKFLANQ